MSIVLIGGSGFIGTCLANRLSSDSEDYSIIDKVHSRKYPEKSVLADVRDIGSLRKTIPENAVLINLAAEHRDDVRPLSLYDEVNVGGARNICKVAREKYVKQIIFTSSVAVYGFAPLNTNESGKIAPFNDYGRTKYEAEQIYIEWQAEAPAERSLLIVRPTVVFGEQNRGNVYNLLNQIASGRFIMIGSGDNKKSMAYVENIAAFLQFGISFQPGVHLYNYIDKPDTSMNQLVSIVKNILGKKNHTWLKMPFLAGFAVGKFFDGLAFLTGKKFAISAIRVKKFCSDTVFDTSLAETNFIPPVTLSDAIIRTVNYEFVNMHRGKDVFYSE